MGLYKRQTIEYTIAVVSYTPWGSKRRTEQEIKINGISTYNKLKLYDYLLSKGKAYEKPYVHTIKKAFYWEE